MTSTFEPEVVFTHCLVRGLPPEHSGRRLADVRVTRVGDRWRVGDAGEWIGPGGARVADSVEMDYDAAIAAAKIEAERLAVAVLAVHPR